MISQMQCQRRYRQVDYVFSGEEHRLYPHLGRLLLQGYSFVVLQRSSQPYTSGINTFVLACEIICSNGTELLQRHETLTPDFKELRELEGYVHHNMMNILHRHFFGRELVSV